MFSLFKSKVNGPSIKDEAVAVVQQACSVAERAVEHTSALGALLSAEIKEYAAHQAQRLVMVVLACVLMLGAYFVFCAALVALLCLWLHLVWSLVIVCALNGGIAFLLLLRVKRMGGKQLAPATVEELQNDWKCLKLLCQGNSKP